MSDLRLALTQYLAVRRSTGFQLKTAERILRSFVGFAEREASVHITTALALRWIQQPSKAQALTWSGRLSVVRCFAKWWSATDPQTEVPPWALLPHGPKRRHPCRWGEDDVPRLLQATALLPSCKGLRGLTYAVFFGLIATTGMRISEALALNRGDVNLEDGVLTIRRTKFAKSRLVPLHATTCRTLAAYAASRDHIAHRASTPAFFLSESGERITEWSARYNFARVSQKIGLRRPEPRCRYGRGPRLHDLRHRFAVQTLVDWYRAGLNVDREIHKLAAYLGHGSVSYTYWYIEGVPELLDLASQRVRERCSS
jgi:integrase/recombinase XerD